MKKLLLLSNSTDAEGRYLHYPEQALVAHLHDVRTLTFVPFAGVTIGWNQYAARVRERFAALSIDVVSIHDQDDPRAAVANAQAIAVGGGNTFHLLACLQQRGLMQAIRNRVLDGIPYVGWSAGSVLACRTIQTTNDMPIVAPETLTGLSLVPYQINAHFTDAHPPGFRGETRRERLAEFIAVNPDTTVIGLPEGDWLEVHDNETRLRGAHAAPLFRSGSAERNVQPGDVVQE